MKGFYNPLNLGFRAEVLGVYIGSLIGGIKGNIRTIAQIVNPKP